MLAGSRDSLRCASRPIIHPPSRFLMTLNTTTFRLEDVRGRQPVILIFAPSERSPAYEAQAGLLQQERIAERGSAVVAHVFCDGDSYLNQEKLDQASADQLRAEYEVGDDDFLIVLIGHDGIEKRRDDAPLQPAVILERISEAGGPQ